MEEKEIIQILKDNKVEGRPYCWMPRDVRIWIDEHYKECAYLNKHGAWDKSSKYINHSSDITMTDIFCLLASYIQPESSGSWEEFEIDQRGNFHCFKDGDMRYFFWASWNVFLKVFSDEFTTFGGWQYEEDGAWFTTHQLFAQESFATVVDYDGICIPVIPKRIRFWRKKQ